MTIEEFMKKHNLSSIVKIYRGKDHACRCGCCGTYSCGPFTRQVNKINRENLIPDNIEDADYHEYKMIAGTEAFLNLPYDPDRDMCYCIYFKKD